MGDDRKKRKSDDFDDIDEFFNNIMKMFMNSFSIFFGQNQPNKRRTITMNEAFTPPTPKQDRIYSILPDESGLTIFIDLRGAKENTINVSVSDNLLIVEALTVEGYYRDRFPLPFRPKKNSIEKRYMNGILEIRVSK